MESRFWAILFGVLPDLTGFSSMFRSEYLKKALFFNKMPGHMIPKKAVASYKAAHNLILWFIVFAVLYFLNQTWWAMLWCGWLIHIFIDIFTHSRKSATSPTIFWPLSDYSFPGFSWSQKKFLIINFSIFALLYWIFYF